MSPNKTAMPRRRLHRLGIMLLVALLTIAGTFAPCSTVAADSQVHRNADVAVGGVTKTTDRQDGEAPLNMLDYGDAPDHGGTPGVGSYNTSATNDGPSHVIDPALYLGSMLPDADSGMLQNVTATADDTAGSADEGDGIVIPPITTASTTVEMAVNFTNLTGDAATVACWIDFNRNGLFGDIAGERASATVGDSSPTTVTFNGFSAIGGITYSRCRIARNGAEVAVPTGLADSGEVEDAWIAIAETPLAVQLSYFLAEPQGEMVGFTWETATETAIAGFELLAMIDGGTVAVTEQMVPSSVIDSVTPTRYTYEASVEHGSFFLEMVNISGETRRFGPFVLGEAHGTPSDSSGRPNRTEALFVPFIAVR